MKLPAQIRLASPAVSRQLVETALSCLFAKQFESASDDRVQDHRVSGGFAHQMAAPTKQQQVVQSRIQSVRVGVLKKEIGTLPESGLAVQKVSVQGTFHQRVHRLLH